MNKINPLHIGALLLVLLVFFIFKLSGVKSELTQTKELYSQTRTIAEDLNGLKKVYTDKQNIKKSINRVLRQSSLRSAKIEKKLTRTGMILSSVSMDKNALNSFMSKILNGSYMIYGMKIKKLDEHRVSMKLEIRW